MGHPHHVDILQVGAFPLAEAFPLVEVPLLLWGIKHGDHHEDPGAFTLVVLLKLAKRGIVNKRALSAM